jgi:UDP-galactopyranose mutase
VELTGLLAWARGTFMNRNIDVIVVGTGPAGLGFLIKSEQSCLVLEKERETGGLMRSKNVNGYIFDWAGHIFFTGISRIKSLVDDIMNPDFHYQNRESWVYSKHTYTRYPFQGNTFGLPTPVVKECLLGLIEATYSSAGREPDNFQEWIHQTYGAGIANHFMIPYNRKLWACDLRDMDHHWLAGRVPRPGLSDFIDGALGPGRKDMGPNARFGYPLVGGIQTLADRLMSMHSHDVRTGETLVSINTADRSIETSTGNVYSYGKLVLTCPLHDILEMTQDIPEEIKTISKSLKYLSVLCVNIGVRRPNITEKHWIYFPEPEFLFHRVFVQGNAAPQVCPDGCFSYTAEITYSDQKRVDFSTAGQKTIDGLLEAGLMRQDDIVDVVDLIDIPVAYIVPTHNRIDIVKKIRKWYADNNIHLVGRFAEWEYYNMDHSLDTGWQLAEELGRL